MTNFADIMKRILTIASAVALLAACGRKAERAVTEIESYSGPAPVIDTMRAVADSVLPPLPPVTSQGVGPIRLGMEVSAIPPQLLGLYDTIEVASGGNGDDAWATLAFMLSDLRIMTADAVGSPLRVASIGVIAPGPGVTIGDRRVTVGDNAGTVARMAGVRGGEDEAGDYLEWRGVMMAVEGDTIAALSIVR